MLNYNNFLDICKTEVVNHYKRAMADEGGTLGVSINDVFVVWYCKTLKNAKALLSTSFPDNKYFELTFNGDSGELYLDVYDKLENRCVKLDE